MDELNLVNKKLVRTTIAKCAGRDIAQPYVSIEVVKHSVAAHGINPDKRFTVVKDKKTNEIIIEGYEFEKHVKEVKKDINLPNVPNEEGIVWPKDTRKGDK